MSKYTKAKTLSLFQLMTLYPTKRKCYKYFEDQVWNKEVACSKCGFNSKLKRQKDGFNYWCGDCRQYFNVFTNTPLERNKIDPRKWLFAGYLMLTSRKGISSLQLSKELDIKQSTAWYMMHRLRLACGKASPLLKGVVQMDESYIGGKEANKHSDKKIPGSQGGATKDIVMGFRDSSGKVKAEVIPNTQQKTLKAKIHKNVAKDAVVCTDELGGYASLSDDYTHLRVNHSAKVFVSGMATTNGIEIF